MNLSDLVTIEYAPLPGSMGAQWADVWESLGDGSRDLVGLPSGLDSLNKKLQGLQGFTVVRGVPGAGKSSFLAWLTLQAAAQGVNCWFISAEMGADGGWLELLRTHYKCSRARLITHGKTEVGLLPPDAFGRIVVTGGQGLTPETFAARSEPFGFVVVDSLHALPQLENRTGYESINAWLDAFGAAKKKGCPGIDGRAVWVISQSTKAADTAGGANLFGGSGSAKISYTPDAELVLSCESEDKTSNEARTVTVEIVKNRLGYLGPFNLQFGPMTGQWAEAPTSPTLSGRSSKTANNGKAQYQRKK